SYILDHLTIYRNNNTFSDPVKFHLIYHEGLYFNVVGPHLVEPSPKRTPVLFQAGGSSRGRNFAAKHAEDVFTKHHSLHALKEYSQDIRRRTKKQGRDPEDVLIFPMILPIIGSTEAEAYANYEDLMNHVSYEGTASLLSGHTGI